MSYLLRNADFAQTPAKNLVLDRRSAGPDHAVAGQLIFNTTLNEAQVFKNGSWQSIGGSPVPEGETIWHTGNDGSGSGLDADLLDGNHASAFAPSSHSHSYLPLSGGSLTGNVSMSASKNLTVGAFTRLTSWANQVDGKAYVWHIHLDGTNAILGYTNSAGTRTVTTLNHSHPYAPTSHTHAYVPTSRTVNSKALSANIALTAADVGAAASSHTHAYLPLTGGTMTGVLYPQRNTSYTTGQARRIIMSTAAPSGGGNGDVWLRYV